MFLIPQCRTGRRATSSGDITVFQTVASTAGTNRSITFAGTPTDGQMIVLVMSSFGGSITPPAGFTELVTSQVNSTTQVTRVFYRVASSEASATYAITNASNGMMAGYRLSACSPGSTDTNSTTTTTSHNAGATGLSAGTNCFVVAAGTYSNTPGTNGVGNSFTLDANSNVGARCALASRKFTTGASGQNAPFTTANSVSGRLLIAIFTP